MPIYRTPAAKPMPPPPTRICVSQPRPARRLPRRCAPTHEQDGAGPQIVGQHIVQQPLGHHQPQHAPSHRAQPHAGQPTGTARARRRKGSEESAPKRAEAAGRQHPHRVPAIGGSPGQRPPIRTERSAAGLARGRRCAHQRMSSRGPTERKMRRPMKPKNIVMGVSSSSRSSFLRAPGDSRGKGDSGQRSDARAAQAGRVGPPLKAPVVLGPAFSAASRECAASAVACR